MNTRWSSTSTSTSSTSTSHYRRNGIDPRPTTPAQLAIVALGLWIVGSLVSGLGILAPLGVILLVGAGIGYLLRPRRRTMYWRGRMIDLDDRETSASRLYRTFFRR